MCQSEIPGVTQVENGHAGSTAVATAYLCWVKYGHRSSRTVVPADYYYLYLLLLFVCSFRVWGVFLVEESVELSKSVLLKKIAVNVSLLLR